MFVYVFLQSWDKVATLHVQTFGGEAVRSSAISVGPGRSKLLSCSSAVRRRRDHETVVVHPRQASLLQYGDKRRGDHDVSMTVSDVGSMCFLRSTSAPSLNGGVLRRLKTVASSWPRKLTVTASDKLVMLHDEYE